MDARVADFLDQLEERGLRDEMLFVLSADHGEMTVQSDVRFMHGIAKEPSIRVPLIFDLPGDTAPRRFPDPVQLVDPMPTMAELVGLEPEPFAFHGRSLVPAMRGKPLSMRPVVIQTFYFNQRAIIHCGWKLVISDASHTPRIAAALTFDRFWKPWAEAHPELARELAGGQDTSIAPAYNEQRYEAFIKRHPEARKELRSFFFKYARVTDLFNLEEDPNEMNNLADREPARL